MNIVIFGLSITSAWGNGHATTFRALVRALDAQGHRVHFFERDVEWYASHRDMPSPPFCELTLYENLSQVRQHESRVRDADVVVVGSYVQEAVALTSWLHGIVNGPLVFYDIDTPVTVTALANDKCAYLTRESIRLYDMYLSFAGGPVLKRLHDEFGAAAVRPLYCSVDPAHYHPVSQRLRYDLGYLGTYSDDRQPVLDRLMRDVARQLCSRQFAVAGAQYPDTISWPPNVDRVEHLPPSEHCAFYNSQRFTLNVTRADMVANGYSPSVRLFEAAACGTPIISDWWAGLDEFFVPGREIIIAVESRDVVQALEMTEAERRTIGYCAMQRVLAAHTAEHRAREFTGYVKEIVDADMPEALR